MNRNTSIEYGVEGSQEDARTFRRRFNDRFLGLRHWSEFDAICDRLRTSPYGWFVYMVGEEPPRLPSSVEQFERFVSEIGALLRAEHDHPYCGIVYVDDRNEPGMIKIYDPARLGSSCGSGGDRVMPKWVLSRCAPTRLDSDGPTPGNRGRWWRRVLRLE